MAVLCVPAVEPDEDERWASLGPQVCDWIESFLVFGPGDLRGQPAVIDDETRALIHRTYQVAGQGQPNEGRRRFNHVVWQLPKGSAKTEKAAWIAILELHPTAPVRCDGFDAHGQPVGTGLADPYIPMVAYTEEQTEELAYGAAYAMLSDCALGNDFDVGLERITRRDGTGRMVALAAAPSSRDGARTTFQHFDETHHMFSARLRRARTSMLANVPKRYGSDAWTFDTTTPYDPGEGSVAQDECEQAQAVAAGQARAPKTFFFWRYASDKHDISKEPELREAIIEAAGPSVAKYRDVDGIVSQFQKPKSDRAYLERVWLSRIVQDSRRAFNVDDIRTRLVLAPEDRPKIDRRRPIVLGFDGSRTGDATGLVATDVETGYQWMAAVWERPATADEDWEVPADEVNAVVDDLFARFNVVWFNADPFFWDDTVSSWAGRFNGRRGRGQVVREYRTNRPKVTALAVRAYRSAIDNGEVTFDGHADFLRHLGNACRRNVPGLFDDQGEPLFLIEKEHRASPLRMDLAMCGTLSWDARLHALSAGHGARRGSGRSFTW